MQYRFLSRVESKIQVHSQYDINIVNPVFAKWPKDWEWFYTESEIWDNLKLSVKLVLYKLFLEFVRWTGAKISYPDPEYHTKVNYVTVDTENIRKALWNKLSENQRNRLYNDELMIVVGAREFHELSEIHDEFSFLLETRMGTSRRDDMGRVVTNYCVLGIPVCVVPDFVGIALLPDMTRQRVMRQDNRRW